MIIALLSLLITSTQSTEIQHVDFYTRDIQYEFVDGYTKVRIKGCEITDAVGAPEIPVKVQSILTVHHLLLVLVLMEMIQILVVQEL